MTGIFLLSALTLVSLLYLSFKAFGGEESVSAVVDVGLEREDETISLLLGLAGNMPSVSSVTELVITDYPSAKKDVEEGRADAAVFIPADFFEDVDSGVNTPVRVIIRDDSGIRGTVFRELLTDAVSMLRSSEACVYTRGALSDEEHRQQAYDEAARELADVIRKRDFIYDEPEMVSAFPGSVRGYFAASFIFGVVFIYASGFSAFYGNEDKRVRLLLKRNGVNPVLPGLASLISCFVSCLCPGMALAAGMVLFGIAGCGAFAGAAIASAAAAVWSCMIFRVFMGREERLVIYTGLTCMLLLCGGGIIPAAFIRPGFLSGIAENFPYYRLIAFAAEVMS
ncbi:MAG: ABC transporter permease [Lachnospiraceae bacterium]|nr:ABC transporter permease [Lachnospiraceae bacterium]